uniref:MARVEL domain-containing protein n=1 Tax=Panagrolaimus sp. PS1159 TaxID=55785 RepID=A0AC35G718_9BILA
MKVINIIKTACILMFVLIADWRNVLNQATEVDVDGKKIKLHAITLPLLPEDKVMSKYGIINNCAIADEEVKCTMTKNDGGFVGDGVIVAFLALTIIFYIINIIIMLTSIFLTSFPPKALYFLPIACFVGSVFLLAAATIFLIYYNTYYVPMKGVAPFDGDTIYKAAVALGAGSLYKQDDDILIGPYPYKIVYGAGFYLVVVATIFSVLSICASGFAAYKSVHDEVVIEEKQEVKVVKVQAESQSSEKNDSQKSN